MTHRELLKNTVKYVISYIKLWRALVAFLVIMMILTIVSRVNDQKLLPKVSTSSIKSMPINHTVTVEGTISYNHKKAVFLPEGLKVASVNVSEGMYVKKGDSLFQIDMNNLKAKIARAKSDAKKQKLQLEDKKKAIMHMKESNNLAVQKANDDYNYISKKETAILGQMEQEWKEIQKELQIYETDPLSKRKSTRLKDLKNAYEEKVKQYNDIVASKTAAISTSERNLEDSKEPYLPDVNILLIEKQLNDTYQELSELTAIRQDDYYVRSNREGIIQMVNINSGDTTGSDMAFLLYDIHNQVNIAVFPETNLKVDSVFIQEQGFLTVNDILYRINKQNLDKRILELQGEAELLNIQLTNGMLSEASQKSLKERMIKKAQEDYDRTVNEWESKKVEANRELQEARKEYETYRDHPMDTDAMKQEYQNLRKEYEDKKSDYDLYVLESENKINTAVSNLEDVKNSYVINQNEAAVMEQDLILLERLINDLEEIKEEQGIIKADSDGKVLDFGVTAGTVIGGDAVALIADQSNGYLFSGLLPMERSKYLNTGDEIDLNIYRGNINMNSLTVTSIETLEDNPDYYSVMVQIPEQEKEIEGNALLTVTKQTETYPYCIPKEGVYSIDEKAYVYLLVEKNTVLGIHSTAIKMGVTILDQNESYAAVKAEFPNNAKVIVNSNKALEDNARVRSIGE